MHYILNGQAGTVEVGTDQAITITDLTSNIHQEHPLTTEQQEKNDVATRPTMKFTEDESDHENRLKIILADIRTDYDKASAEEQRKKIALFEAASKMQRQVILLSQRRTASTNLQS